MTNQIADFKRYLLVEKGLSQNTVSSYTRDLMKFKAYLEQQKLADFKQDRFVILNFLATLKAQAMANNSVIRMVSSLRKFYRFLLETEQITIDPMQQVTHPRNNSIYPRFYRKQRSNGC